MRDSVHDRADDWRDTAPRASGPIAALLIGGIGGAALAALALGSGLGWTVAFLAYGLGSAVLLAVVAAATDRPRPARRRAPAWARLAQARHG